MAIVGVKMKRDGVVTLVNVEKVLHILCIEYGHLLVPL